MAIPIPEPTGDPKIDRNFFSLWMEIERLGQLLRVGQTAAPAVTDDQTKGITIGTLWVDETADVSYQCQDNTPGAAVWVQID